MNGYDTHTQMILVKDIQARLQADAAAHRLAVRLAVRRDPTPARGLVNDLTRLLVAGVLVALALTAIAVAGTLQALNAMPADGPAPGLGLVTPFADLDQRGWQ